MKQFSFHKNSTLEDTTIIFLEEGYQPFPSVTLPTHKLPGVNCKGWSLTPGGALVTDAFITVTTNLDFYPVWENLPDVLSYELTFKPNGGNGNPYVLVYDEEGTVTLPTTTTFTHPLGWEFAGWGLKGNDIMPTKTIYLDKDTNVYAIWREPAQPESEAGIGKLSGKYIPVYNTDRATKFPVTTKGYLPLLQFFPSAYLMKHDGTLWVYYKKPNGEVEKKGYNRPTNHQIDLSKGLENYWISIDRETGITDYIPIKDVGNARVLRFIKVKDLTPIGVFGKKFLGWATSPNTDVPVDEETLGSDIKSMLWPIYRKGDPQYNVTIDFNDGSGDRVVVENIVNEALFIDEDFVSTAGFPTPEGKVLAGFSTRPNGTPIFFDYIIINRDTTIYPIWVDEE